MNLNWRERHSCSTKFLVAKGLPRAVFSVPTGSLEAPVKQSEEPVEH